VAVGSASGHLVGSIGQDTGDQVMIHVPIPYSMVRPKGAMIDHIQQDSLMYVMAPSRDRELVFEVTGTCDEVKIARRDIESYIALSTGTTPDSVATQ